jgi:ABC-type branched-subunit amino acid transport system ATPase component
MGKTTLCLAIVGLLGKAAGSVRLEGQEMLAERQLIMAIGTIATETTAKALVEDPAAQRRYLGVEPLPDAA